MTVFKELEASLIHYMKQLRATRANPPKELKYTSIEDIVLKHGVVMQRDIEGEKKVKRGTPKECFGNAGYLVAKNPERYIYCEGYAISDKLPIAIHHGWVFDTHTGMAIDPTWNLEREVCYIGIPFATKFVRYCYQEFGYYSLLDYPAISRWATAGFPEDAFETISPKL